jgi:hypothetical protein
MEEFPAVFDRFPGLLPFDFHGLSDRRFVVAEGPQILWFSRRWLTIDCSGRSIFQQPCSVQLSGMCCRSPQLLAKV